MTYQPSDWKVFHAAKVAAIDHVKRDQAVAFLRRELDKPAPRIRVVIAGDPQEWWIPYHFHWLMSIRNLLRSNAFGEKELGVDNLDARPPCATPRFRRRMAAVATERGVDLEVETAIR